MRMPLLLLGGGAAGLLVAVVAVRFIPDPQRTAHAMFDDDFWGVGDDLAPFNKFRLLRTGASTGGEYIEMEELHTGNCGTGTAEGCAAERCAPPYHLHTKQNETFEVLQGEFQYVFEGKVHVARAGETVSVPAGAKHTFCRAPSMAADQPLVIRFRLAPALNADQFFPNFVGTFRDTKMNPSPVQLIWLVCAHNLRLADIPRPVHDVMCASLDLLGPALGYHLQYDEYAVSPVPPPPPAA